MTRLLCELDVVIYLVDVVKEIISYSLFEFAPSVVYVAGPDGWGSILERTESFLWTKDSSTNKYMAVLWDIRYHPL